MKAQVYILSLIDKSGVLNKIELLNWLNNALKDKEAFLSLQAQKLELYLIQLAEQKINKTEFEENCRFLKNSLESKIIQNELKNKENGKIMLDYLQQVFLDKFPKLIQ